MKRGLVLALLLLAGAAPADPPPDPPPAMPALRIAVPNPGFAAALARAVLPGFTAARGIGVAATDWDGSLASLTLAAGAAAPWDVVAIDPARLALACAQGLVQSLRHDGCGVRAARPALLLSWDRRKLSASPNWADFWDVAKYPGKRGLHAGPRGTLEIALLADGVAPGDVYTTLRGNAGVDRAFRKLDQLRPYLVWWHEDAEAAAILRTGQALMSSAPSGAIAAADAEGAQDFGMQWQGSLFGEIDWAMLTGSHADTAAAQFLAFATDRAQQAALVPLGYAPPADARPALVIDDTFWRQSGPALRARFAAWLQR